MLADRVFYPGHPGLSADNLLTIGPVSGGCQGTTHKIHLLVVIGVTRDKYDEETATAMIIKLGQNNSAEADSHDTRSRYLAKPLVPNRASPLGYQGDQPVTPRYVSHLSRL
ncbi:uncharacterized protein EV420DRAFT_1474814 [Desarmillaria tabescens]|uniref:Uncharacterized protein n=1 Tax=Armillaria tabescens TaxID=1929756 RepID=A0AA39T5J5_ARMTA|nr:uncharacterized protein EV420DRAFT_1474814 [Desarmillaria tabescens]KAK0466001.1 hypothetical protein EV420DRAFT_1474814 [Desarmillaria tabescens]